MKTNFDISKNEQMKDNHLLNKVGISFSKSKEEVWETLIEKIDDNFTEKPKGKLIQLTWVKLAAASVVLLFGVFSILRFYSISVNCPKGKHISYILPDGSSVELNSLSNLSYNPFWWGISRELNFEGEGFFEVEKGSKFRVISNNGITEVLGTSFNVNSRADSYLVACKTGKIRVSREDVNLIISPGQMAIIDAVTNKGIIENNISKDVYSWKEDKFYFKKVVLKSVIEEIERQYDVTISFDKKATEELIYSGSFNKKKDVDATLDIICKSFNLKFTLIGNNKYNISRNN
jgi:transmembrane sensor